MGLLNFKKCVFGLKNDFLGVKENKKVTNYLLIKYRRYSILRIWNCENVRHLGFREYWQSLFSPNWEVSFQYCILQAPPCSKLLMLHSFFLFRWFLAPSPWPTMRTSFRYSFIVPHESEIKLSDHKMYLFNVQMCHNTWILCIVQQPYVQTYKISNIKSKPFMTFFFVKLKDYWQWRCSEKTDNLGWPSIPLAPNEIISHLMKPG